MPLVAITQLAAFAATSLVCIAAPGPDNMAVLSLGLSRGRSAGVGFALGCALGCITHTTWAALGVAALIAANPWAFVALKAAGAAYLAYLGIRALRSTGTLLPETMETPQATRQYLARGFIANAVNPKVALFFLAFLPQFVTRQASAPAQMALLGLTFAVLSGAVFCGIGLFSGSVGAWLRRRSSAGVWLDRLTGCLFLGLAGFLLVAHRQTR